MSAEADEGRRAVRDLLARCDEEIDDDAGAAVLRSEFARAVTPQIASELLNEGQFCRAFALGCADAVDRQPELWSTSVLAVLTDMQLHNGDLGAADALSRECLRRDPRNANFLVNWALSAANVNQVMSRFRIALDRTDDGASLRARAEAFVEHHKEKRALLAILDDAREDGEPKQ